MWHKYYSTSGLSVLLFQSIDDVEATMNLRALLVVSGILGLSSGAALAADLPRKAPPPPVPAPVVMSWTGFYLGGQVGWGRARWDTSNFISTPGVGPFASPGFPIGSTDGSGVVGGIHGGFNYQWQNIVAGIEADINWTNIDDTVSYRAIGIGAGLPFAIKYSLDYYGTVRGRLGYAWDRFLVYVTGGWAYGHSNIDITSPGQFFGPFATSASNKNHTGWTVGGGFSYMITPNWIAGLEYKHIDLGDETNVYAFPAAPVTGTTDLKIDEVTLRVSYKF